MKVMHLLLPEVLYGAKTFQLLYHTKVLHQTVSDPGFSVVLLRDLTAMQTIMLGPLHQMNTELFMVTYKALQHSLFYLGLLL
jgi:hypothetical protein